MPRLRQQSLFEETREPSAGRNATSSTFADNVSLPVHRWFRYSAGFSSQWAESVIEEHARTHGSTRVLDPFAGSGTTLLAAEDAGVASVGIEAHPFVWKIAQAKLHRRTDVEAYVALARELRRKSASIPGDASHYPNLIHRCFSPESLLQLDRLRRALVDFQEETPAWHLAWLTLCAILRPVASAGTAQWQYILPNKEKKRTLDPLEAFDAMSRQVAADMRASVSDRPAPRAELLNSDARTCGGVADRSVDLVVTSPPYPNNYDYADATRFEMCFFGEIDGWGDLQEKVRRRLVRSCSQHVPQKEIDLEEVLASAVVDPIRAPLVDICRQLAEVRLTKGGKKTYHLMVACYFHDLAQVWTSLRRVCVDGCRACFVIGDSAPYGVYVPVMEWMGALAVAAGFDRFEFEKTRDRNVKWKNRKHRVPLSEGRLWVEG